MFRNMEWDMMSEAETLREKAILASDEAFEKGKDRIFSAWKIVVQLVKMIYEEGLLAAESEIENLSAKDVPFYDYLHILICLMTDGTSQNLILEIVSNDYYTRKNLKEEELYILYLYMTLVQQVCHPEKIYGAKEIRMEDVLVNYLDKVPYLYREEFRMRLEE